MPRCPAVASFTFILYSEGDKTDFFDSPRPQFFNATKMAVGADMVTKAIAWRAFPNSITQLFPADVDRWSRADASRDRQESSSNMICTAWVALVDQVPQALAKIACKD
jgi:hypothetical protein